MFLALIDVVAPVLEAGGCRDFFVASAAEGVELRSVAPDATIRVHLEVEGEFGQVDLPDHPGRQLTWHRLDDELRGSHMVRALGAEEIGSDTAIWSAGQAAAMQKVRNHLFKDRGVSRSQATVRGYWK